MKRTFFLILLASLTFVSCKPAPTLPKKINEDKQEEIRPKATPEQSLLRVNATQQGYNYVMPWEKESPSSRGSLGVVLEGGVVLTTANVVHNATYLSFSTYDKSRTFPARVVAVDYEANLALLAPLKESDQEVVNTMIPMELSGNLLRGSAVELWQLGDEGLPIITKSDIQNFEMFPPLVSGRPFLEYKIKAAVQSLGNSFTLPVVKEGKLAGMLLSYDRNNQISKVLDISVLKDFVKDALDGNYKGFPSLGILGEETKDPAFRKYLHLSDEQGGLYIAKVNPFNSAGQAGIKRGDVLLSINGQKIDSRGYYDSPLYGKLEYTRLINGEQKVGDKVMMTVLRDGEQKDIPVTLMAPSDVKQVIQPYLYDKAPNYVLYGGMVFVELSLPFLESYGKNWAHSMSNGLVDAVLNPDPYIEKGIDHFVICSSVIPTAATLGYGGLSGQMVSSVNGKPVKNLKDLSSALDENKEDIQTISLIRAPYHIYLSQKKVKEVEPDLKERLTPVLRKLD